MPKVEIEFGIANVACFVGVGVEFLAGMILAFSLVSGWFAGVEAGEMVNVGGDTVLDFKGGLWDYTLQVRRDLADGITDTQDVAMSWDEFCSANSETMRGADGTCMKIALVRAFCFMGWFMGLAAAAVLLFAGLKMPIMALVGAAVSTLQTIIALGAAVFASSMSTAIGFGVILAAGSMMTGILGSCVSLYATGKAVKVEQDREDPVDPNEGNRQERVSTAREVAAEKQAALMSTGRRPATSQDGSEAGSRASDEPEKKIPVFLKRVLNWDDEKEDDDDEIPTDLLQRAFWEIDEDGSGSIEMGELVGALQLCGLPASEAAMSQVMCEIDKNNDGEIDLGEFVDFFRQLEEMDDFEKKSAAKQQFATFMLNFCFLVFIIIVGILLMMFIRMEEDTPEDTKVIMQNGLMACSITLFALFICVVAMPAARLTLGPSIGAFRSQAKSFQFRRKVKEEAPSSGPREIAWQPEVAPVAPEMLAQSYRRVGKVQAMLEYSQEVAQDQTAMVPVQVNARDRSKDPGSSRPPRQPQAMSDGVPGVIMNEQGMFERYNPDAYARTEEQMIGAGLFNRTTATFSPMQVSADIHTALRDAEDVNSRTGIGGQLALGNGQNLF